VPDSTIWQRHDPEDLPFAEIKQPITCFLSAIMGWTTPGVVTNAPRRPDRRW
jgi:hypothetical protein